MGSGSGHSNRYLRDFGRTRGHPVAIYGVLSPGGRLVAIYETLAAADLVAISCVWHTWEASQSLFTTLCAPPLQSLFTRFWTSRRLSSRYLRNFGSKICLPIEPRSAGGPKLAGPVKT